MNNLMSYGDEEEEERLREEEGSSTSRLATTTNDRSNNVQGSDLSWLAPPPRKVNGILDHEWGLGIERSLSDTGECSSASLTAKLANFHELKQKGIHFNQSLNKNRSFRNPHIYAKLVDWIGVDENTSGYRQFLRKNNKPVDEQEAEKVWSSSSSARKALKRRASAERIAEMQKRQQEESDKGKLRGKREKIDFAPASSSSSTAQQEARKIRDESDRQHSTESSRRRAKDAERYRESHRHKDRDRHGKSRDHRKD